MQNFKNRRKNEKKEETRNGLVLFLAFPFGNEVFGLEAAPSGKVTLVMDNDAPTMDPHRHAEVRVTVNWQMFDSSCSGRTKKKIGRGWPKLQTHHSQVIQRFEEER
jgi:hypothetical protein